MKNYKKCWDNGELRVSCNKKYLENGDKPFFWLGDTAWLLFQRLNKEESYSFLKNRKDKGFNVIQAVLVRSPEPNNKNLCLSLENNDFSNTKFYGGDCYWNYVDSIIKMAEQLGMYMALLPVWGSVVKQGYLTEENAEGYASFLGNRYKDYKNIIWLLGGDIRGDKNFEVWNIMGSTLKKLNSNKLISFHPFGRTSSSKWFNDCEWLDFNMFQSGHRRYDQMSLNSWDDLSKNDEWYGEDSFKYVVHDHSLSNLKPTLDGEPSYEQIPHGLHDPKEGFWQDYDVRRYAYWSVFAGACGFTYGSNAVMQFYMNGFEASYGAKEYWYDAMHHNGSSQVGILKKLIEKFPYNEGKPCMDVLNGDEGEKYNRICTFKGQDFILLYDYSGREFQIKMGKISGDKVNAWWFNPQNGMFSFIGKLQNDGISTFKPVRNDSIANDIVLILCDENKDYI
jgi:hypothetical protein